MRIKNKRERLSSLFHLWSKAETEIKEIASFSPKTSLPENMTVAEYLGIGVAHSDQFIANQKESAIIMELRNYMLPISKEIEYLKLMLSKQKKPVAVPVEKRYARMFVITMEAEEVILLFKTHDYTTPKGVWTGHTSFTGKLKVAFTVLLEWNVFTEEITNPTAYVRIFYDSVASTPSRNDNLLIEFFTDGKRQIGIL